MTKRQWYFVLVLVVLFVSGVLFRWALMESEETPGPGIVQGEDWNPDRTIEGEWLTEEEIAALLGRATALDEPEDQKPDFEYLERSAVLPDVADEFDPEQWEDWAASVPTAEPDGEVSVLSVQPQGEAEPPFQAAVIFDRPMVPVGAISDSEPPPLEISPQIEGEWRWLGATTAAFQPAEEWPMATEFSVRIPQGTEAVDGTALDDEESFEFTTPGAEVVEIQPTLRHRIRPAMGRPYDQAVGVIFNQPVVDSASELLSVQTAGEEVPMRPLDGDDLEEAAEELSATEALAEERFLALEPRDKFPPDATVEVSVQGPLASREGSVVTVVDESLIFRVRDQFHFERTSCLRGTCSPDSRVRLSFSSRLERTDVESHIDIEPPVDDLSVRRRGSSITLEGSFEANTEYTITLSEELEDTYEQRLIGERQDTISIGPASPSIRGPRESMVVRPTYVAAKMPVEIRGIDEVRLLRWLATCLAHRSLRRR